MVRQKGLEPPAYCLEGSCSIQLSYWRISYGTRSSSLLERVKGIEPSYPAWKAGVLPLNYTRKLKKDSMKPRACQVFFFESPRFPAAAGNRGDRMVCISRGTAF